MHQSSKSSLGLLKEALLKPPAHLFGFIVLFRPLVLQSKSVTRN